MSSQPTFEKTSIVKAMEEQDEVLYHESSDVDDLDFLKEKLYQWDDLNTLKDSLGSNIMDFISQVNSLIISPTVISNLKDRKPEFDKLVQVFYSDVSAFSKDVAIIRTKHENKTGAIQTGEDFDEYNRLAIEYHNLFTELSSLVTPTLSSLMVLLSELEQPAQDTEATEEEQPNVQ